MTQSIEPLMGFFLREKGESVQINGIRHKALIQDVVDKILSADEKIIRTTVPLHTGDFVDYHNERFMITSQIDINETSYRGRIRKCNERIAFNWSGNVKWFDAIVEGKFFSMEEGKIMSLPIGKIQVILQDNAGTRDIKLNQRFYQGHQPFKVTGMDNTQTGLIIFSCALDSKSSFDDVEGNIVDRWSYEGNHTYTLTIDKGTEASVLLNDTLKLNVTATDNGSPLVNPAITFISSDPSVISVDNEGKVLGIKLGQATITAKLTYHPAVQDTMQVTTVQSLAHNYCITIAGSLSIDLGLSTSYVAAIYDNGTEVYDQSVVWSLRNQDNSIPVMGSITASTGNSATIKANSISSYINKYLVLSAALSSDSSISAEKTIQLKSLI